MSITIGFTGTRKGMNWTQWSVIFNLLKSIRPRLARHGMCKGADEQFDKLCYMAGIETEGYPQDSLPQWRSKKCHCTKVHPAKSPLERNKKIVQASDMMIAAPKTEDERGEPRSGTWATIRYAKDRKVRLWIVLPNGDVQAFTPKGKKYVKEQRAS